ncbi:nucleoside deaminase [Pseudomaricurvus sp. HS19]|uniref:nucleoside deaminase n=1 Tax=Pseudomaricurvus sp. HS19 TaxID=2692626 RepID=UPI001367C312|nr:nucleoside deaminase [Pseudomaricurvus sp. HS19]MYM63015.1 nucleoside deaminase [Pseudomaricurvus sp. HS19]
MECVPHRIEFSLPDWVQLFCSAYAPTTDPAQQMRFVIAAAQRNVESATGGPFAAAVFVQTSGELVALGVNLVTHQGLSVLHAEMVALMVAQRRLGCFDLSSTAQAPLTLVTSTEPCAMCLGGICWSGVQRVITGACEADARAVGFDEGPKPQDWQAELRQRGIQVTAREEADAAREVLRNYQQSGRPIYNPGNR